MEALIPAAFLAGLLMFLAPCTLPMVPAYLAFIAGTVPGEPLIRRRVVRNAVAFVIGFSVVFVLLGVFAGSAGLLLAPYRGVLAKLAGVLFVFFGLTMLGLVRFSFLRERRFRLPSLLTLGRLESSFLIGALFSLGWSPCVGPVLGTVLLLASSEATVSRGALLLSVFSLGLAVPFLITAFFIERTGAFFTKIAGAARFLSLLGGVILVLLGILMLTGNMNLLVVWGFGVLDGPYRSLLQYM